MKIWPRNDNYSRKTSLLEIFILSNGLKTFMKASRIYMEAYFEKPFYMKYAQLSKI